MNFFRFKEPENFGMGVIENNHGIPVKQDVTQSTEKTVIKISTKVKNNSYELPAMPKLKNPIKFGGKQQRTVANVLNNKEQVGNINVQGASQVLG